MQPYCYRTQHGAEVDLVLVKGQKPVICIEVKYSKSPVPTQGFYQSADDLAVKHRWVVYYGDETYSNKAGANFISLATCIERIKNYK
jgi:hypothetical protein